MAKQRRSRGLTRVDTLATASACRRENGKVIYMHRQIMKAPPGMDVDHINLQGLDNRKRNMRNCTRAQNGYNHRPLSCGTGFRGVRYVERTGKYEAFIRHNRKETPDRGV